VRLVGWWVWCASRAVYLPTLAIGLSRLSDRIIKRGNQNIAPVTLAAPDAASCHSHRVVRSSTPYGYGTRCLVAGKTGNRSHRSQYNCERVLLGVGCHVCHNFFGGSHRRKLLRALATKRSKSLA